MATIYDVAKKAGVSPSTVSRVLNNYENVRIETSKKVKNACDELNYIRNANASNLKKKNSKNLALIIPDIENPFFISILKGFEDRAHKSQYTTIICNTKGNSKKENQLIEMAISKNFDGLAVGTSSKSKEIFKEILGRNISLVMLDRKLKNMDVDIVCGDSKEGAYKLTKHLIDNSYHNIGFITAPLHLSTSRERLEGYREALLEVGIKYNENLVKIENKHDGYSNEEAYHLAKDLVINEKIDSIFVANNMMVLSVYKALKELNVSVPKDLAVVCFDDLNLMHQINPFFTVMKQPAYTMGKLAANILINRIENKIQLNKQQIVLQPELIIRESSHNITN